MLHRINFRLSGNRNCKKRLLIINNSTYLIQGPFPYSKGKKPKKNSSLVVIDEDHLGSQLQLGYEVPGSSLDLSSATLDEETSDEVIKGIGF